MKLLALDTASELCSAALWLDGRVLARETLAPRAHAALILPMIDALLSEGGSSVIEMDAIAFGRGPGAFTGVRLATAIAQGLGFAAQRSLIAISDLRAMAAQALALIPEADRVVVCQDARMQEVYWACFERAPAGELAGPGSGEGGREACGPRALHPTPGRALLTIGVERVDPAASVQLPPHWSQFVAAGPGFAAYPQLLSSLPSTVMAVLPQLQPRAREIAELAAQDGLSAAVPPEEALPVYLRDRVAVIPRGLPPHS